MFDFFNKKLRKPTQSTARYDEEIMGNSNTYYDHNEYDDIEDFDREYGEEQAVYRDDTMHYIDDDAPYNDDIDYNEYDDDTCYDAQYSEDETDGYRTSNTLMNAPYERPSRTTYHHTKPNVLYDDRTDDERRDDEQAHHKVRLRRDFSFEHVKEATKPHRAYHREMDRFLNKGIVMTALLLVVVLLIAFLY